MKNNNFILIASFLIVSTTSLSQAHARPQILSNQQTQTAEDIDSLGGNEKILDMAKKIRSTSRARIVQERIVDRNNTLEFGLSYGSVFSGDAYLKTKTIGLNADYHINPRWSLGVRYYDFGSALTNEGERIFSQARAAYQAGGRAQIVDIDTPQNAAFAVVNWYPIYGKTSFLDMGINQFDLYLLAGAGSINLASGSTNLFATGLGIGSWLSKHVSARAELRLQKYEDQLVSGTRQLDTVVGSVGLGWIL